MKHTDFFAQTRAIKTKEYKELYAAVEDMEVFMNGACPTEAIQSLPII